MLAEIVAEVVRVEQPIHQEEVGRRLASLCGLQRAGHRIQEAAERGLAWARQEGQLRNDGFFWELPGREAILARDRSDLAPGDTLRKPAMISTREMAAAASLALQRNLALSRDELVVETAGLLGFLRTGRDVSAAIDAAIDDPQFAATVETDHLGRLRLKSGG